MKKIVMVLVCVMISGCLYGKNRGLNIPNIYKSISINEASNGSLKQKKVYILKDGSDSKEALSSSGVKQYAYENGSRFTSRSDLMIKFIDKTKVDLRSFEKEYGLKLKRKMNSGDYLFVSLDGDILKKIDKISQKMKKNIKRIMPNVVLNMKHR